MRRISDAGYRSEANLKQLHEQGIAALIADGLMRRRDERFKEQAKRKADTQWKLYCLVHNIEKLAHHGYAY